MLNFANAFSADGYSKQYDNIQQCTNQISAIALVSDITRLQLWQDKILDFIKFNIKFGR